MAATAILATTTWAGGLMTNTNYHIAFDRMFARGASTEIDATFSNPAGLVWGHDGWQLSLNFQKPWQNRDIELTAPNGTKTLYEGKAYRARTVRFIQEGPLGSQWHDWYRRKRWLRSV